MAKVHGSSIKDDKKYEGLRKKGMSTERAAKIANTPNASSEGSKSSSRSSSSSSSGRSTSQRKAAAGRKGGRKSH